MEGALYWKEPKMDIFTYYKKIRMINRYILLGDNRKIMVSLHKVKEKCNTFEAKVNIYFLIVEKLMQNMNLTVLKYFSDHFFNDTDVNLGTLSYYAVQCGFPSFFQSAWFLYQSVDDWFFREKYFAVLMYILTNHYSYLVKTDLETVKEAIELTAVYSECEERKRLDVIYPLVCEKLEFLNKKNS